MAEEKNLYSVTINALDEAIHVVDKSLKILIFNEKLASWARKTGYSEEIEGRNIFEVFPFLDKKVLEEYRMVFKMAKPVVTEESTKVDGEKIIIRTRKLPILGHDEIVGVVTIMEDITNQRQVEEAFREAEARRKLIFETMNSGIIYQDADGKVIDVNPAVERILKVKNEDILGERLENNNWRVFREDGSSLSEDEMPATIALKTGRKVLGENIGIRTSGRPYLFWLKVNSIPEFRRGENKPCRVYTIFDDITKEREEEIRGKRQMSELERMNKLMVDRELKMVELKKELDRLKEEK